MNADNQHGRPEPSRSKMLIALATCVYDIWYKLEGVGSDTKVRTFDNMCSGDLERVARILQRAGFTEYLDDIGRRSEFICVPEEFEEVASSPQADFLTVGEVEEAVVRLAAASLETTLEIEELAMLVERGSSRSSV